MRGFGPAGALLLALLLPLAAVACGDDATGISAEAAGTYTLRTIDGDSLPAMEFEDDSYSAEVLNASLTLRADGTCSYLGRYRETFKETDTVEEGDYTSGCTVQLSDTNLTLSFAELTMTGTLVDDIITVDAAGQVWVFSR